MAQDYDNMAKDLLTDHATDISQFVLGEEDVEVLEAGVFEEIPTGPDSHRFTNIESNDGISRRQKSHTRRSMASQVWLPRRLPLKTCSNSTEQQLVIAQRTDSTKRVRLNNREAIFTPPTSHSLYSARKMSKSLKTLTPNNNLLSHNARIVQSASALTMQLRDSTRKPMWARNAQYQGYLVGKYEMPVYSNVIYFHPTAGRNDTGRYEYSWSGYEYTLRYKVIRLIEIEGQAILERQAPGLLPFTPLMQPPAGMPPENWAQECIDATRAAPVDQKTEADLLFALYLFGSIVYDPQVFKRRIPEELMRESKGYQLMLRENTIEHIIALLEQQFHTEAVRALTPMLQNINDLERLKELHLAAARVPNIENFAQKLID